MIRPTVRIPVNSWFTGPRTIAPVLRAVCRTLISSGVHCMTDSAVQVVHGMGETVAGGSRNRPMKSYAVSEAGAKQSLPACLVNIRTHFQSRALIRVRLNRPPLA